jgi:hypothetical protein
MNVTSMSGRLVVLMLDVDSGCLWARWKNRSWISTGRPGSAIFGFGECVLSMLVGSGG